MVTSAMKVAVKRQYSWTRTQIKVLVVVGTVTTQSREKEVSTIILTAQQSVVIIITITTGLKRKQKDVDSSVELSTVLTKFIEVSEECERKRQAFEAKFRERERKHKERMLMMMMGIMQQISCPHIVLIMAYLPTPHTPHNLPIPQCHPIHLISLHLLVLFHLMVVLKTHHLISLHLLVLLHLMAIILKTHKHLVSTTSTTTDAKVIPKLLFIISL